MNVTDHDAAYDFRFVTFMGAATAAAFLLLAMVTTQVDVIQAGLPFTDDPYDGVTWFSVFGILLVAGATVVRAIGHRSGAYDPAVARRIAIGAAIAIVIATVGVASDLIALVLVGVPRGATGFGVVIMLLLLAAANAVLGLVATWRARSWLGHVPPRDDPEPDLIDEVGAIVSAVGARRIAGRVIGWVERSPLSPRRHRILVGVLAAWLAGVAAIAWHVLLEGAWASPAAALLFGGIMAFIVISLYLLFLEPLRIVRSPRPD